MSPFPLQSRNGSQVITRDRRLVVEAGMRPEEVVVSDEERGQRHGAGFRIEAIGRLRMEFVGPIKAFDELFERPESF